MSEYRPGEHNYHIYISSGDQTLVGKGISSESHYRLGNIQEPEVLRRCSRVTCEQRGNSRERCGGLSARLLICTTLRHQERSQGKKKKKDWRMGNLRGQEMIDGVTCIHSKLPLYNMVPYKKNNNNLKLLGNTTRSLTLASHSGSITEYH